MKIVKVACAALVLSMVQMYCPAKYCHQNQHAMDKSQEDRIAQEKIEREALDTALSSSSRVERFLLSAASSGSISSQYADIKNEFSKYSRPRSGKDDDWRGSPTGFSPRSRGRSVAKGIVFGGRPSTRGSYGDIEFNVGDDGENDSSDSSENESDEDMDEHYQKMSACL